MIPPETWLYPPGSSDGPSSYELSFAVAASSSNPIQLHFDGGIENSSFFNSANVLFWFDWTDGDGTSHTNNPELFTMDPILGIRTSRNAEFFVRDFMVPYSPAGVSVHFANDTTGSLDGRPVLVSGTFEIVPEAPCLALLIVATGCLLGRRSIA